MEPARLEEQLCFQLYAASRAVTGAYRRPLAQIGLTYPQYLTMLSLWEHDGQSVSELQAALNLDSGTVSPLVKRLTALGLVEKRRSDEDERTVTVHLTEKGQSLEPKAGPVRRAVESSTGLSPDQFEALRSTLEALRMSVEGDRTK